MIGVKEVHAMGYARILKDNDGKPSGYRECDGEVAFMPKQQSYENTFRRIKIDVETMEVLNHDFIKDSEFVYYFTHSTETSYAVRLKTCKNSAAFTILSDGYTKDDNRVYYCQVTVKRAIPQSFTVLRDGYACDDQHVFWGNCLLHVDRDSFNVLENGYAEDKYHSIHGIVVTKKKGV